jgi:phosphonate transport system permease protein
VSVGAAPVPRGPRPTRPRPGPTRWIAVGGVVAVTAWAASSATGIGLLAQLGELLESGMSQRTRQVIAQILSPDWSVIGATVGPFVETLSMAVLGTTIGCGLALLVAFGASRVTARGRTDYALTKSLMSLLRSVPDVLWALLFVSAVGSGTVSGVLALILFNIGVVAKLQSETIDAVDTGPLEAAAATGAGVVKRARAAVFPQVLPNYLAYSLYAFELNVRASAVLGLVGAGGIGQLLNIARNSFRYDRVSLIVVEIFVFVFITEMVSISLRRRLV